MTEPLEPKSEVQAEPKPEVQPERGPERIPEARTNRKPADAKSDLTFDLTPDTQPEVKPDVKSDLESDDFTMEEYEELKRRNRSRLIGAGAVTVLVCSLLWAVTGNESADKNKAAAEASAVSPQISVAASEAAHDTAANEEPNLMVSVPESSAPSDNTASIAASDTAKPVADTSKVETQPTEMQHTEEQPAHSRKF